MMNKTFDANPHNHARIIGTIIDTVELSHVVTSKSNSNNIDANNIRLVRFTVATFRLSGQADFAHIIVSEEAYNSAITEIHEDLIVEVTGRLQSYRHINSETGNRKLDVFVQVKTLRVLDDSEIEDICDEDVDVNFVVIEGHLCKAPVIRKTLKGRIIADLFVAVKRPTGSSYIPVILWSGNAERAASFKRGDKLRLVGRLQSREIMKTVAGETILRMVHELSASKVRLL